MKHETEDNIVRSVVTMIMVAPGCIWYGWVFKVLWGWYCVPILGAPVLTIPQAIGLSLLIKFVARGPARYETKEERERPIGKIIGGDIAVTILRPLIALGIGWVVRFWL